MVEMITTYVVQHWVEGYDYWANCAEPTARMFDLPNPYHESAAGGYEHLERLRAANPGGKYRLVRHTTMIEEIS